QRRSRARAHRGQRPAGEQEGIEGPRRRFPDPSGVSGLAVFGLFRRAGFGRRLDVGLARERNAVEVDRSATDLVGELFVDLPVGEDFAAAVALEVKATETVVVD